MRELDKIVLLLISLIVLMLTISVKDLKDRIDELEESNTQVHEYILNRIGG